MKIVIPVIALSALIASSASAWSGSTGNMQIKMKIDKECTVNPGGGAVLDFGEYGIQTGDIDKESSIKVQCTKDVTYAIGLNRGQNDRRMSNKNNDFISYQLYFDSARSRSWKTISSAPVGNPSDSTNTLARANGIVATANGTVQSYTVYGRVKKEDAALAAIGTYSDTVTVTVNF